MNRLDFVRYGLDSSNPDRTRSYEYDDVGNLLTVVESEDAKACVSYTYDNLNRVSSETSVGVTHTYTYDLNGNRTNALYGVTDRNVAWAYDALNRIISIVAEGADLGSPDVTQYRYDLNSKPIYRQYPTGVEELRTFDPMGRLLTMATTNSVNNESFDMTYQYDAVGSALQMVQNTWNLDTEVPTTVTNLWAYDDRYRLTNETVTILSPSASNVQHSTTYSWDNADNRLSKEASVNGSSTSSIEYDYNTLNQLEYCYDSKTCEDKWFYYDANGSRTNKTGYMGFGLTFLSTAYVYDEDNRLISTGRANSPSEPLVTTHEFSYDYRSRRYYRATPSGTNLCVFDGGLSIQEYDASDLTLNPLTLNTLATEYIRGEGMGGGVGGMVYSLKHNTENLNPQIICSHANHRGDVIARSDMNGTLTSFALYEAYGTRPYEWGDDPDRQKANTKEEEKDLGLLNEGMRYRDLETGTFLTRDPLGYQDGPNVYCYVQCNPITRFDPVGLSWTLDTEGVTTKWYQSATTTYLEKTDQSYASSDGGRRVTSDGVPEVFVKDVEKSFGITTFESEGWRAAQGSREMAGFNQDSDGKFSVDTIERKGFTDGEKVQILADVGSYHKPLNDLRTVQELITPGVGVGKLGNSKLGQLAWKATGGMVKSAWEQTIKNNEVTLLETLGGGVKGVGGSLLTDHIKTFGFDESLKTDVVSKYLTDLGLGKLLDKTIDVSVEILEDEIQQPEPVVVDTPVVDAPQ